MSFTCPRCAAVSHHPEDERKGYCARCRWWTGDTLLGLPHVIEEAEREGAIDTLDELDARDHRLTVQQREALLVADRDGWLPALTPVALQKALAKRGIVQRARRGIHLHARLTNDGWKIRKRLTRALEGRAR